MLDQVALKDYMFIRMDGGYMTNTHRNKQLLRNSGGNYGTQQITMATQAIGVQARGAGGLQSPPTFGQLRFFGQQDKFGQGFLKKFRYFLEEVDIFYFT